jgi:hypothetical protein
VEVLRVQASADLICRLLYGGYVDNKADVRLYVYLRFPRSREGYASFGWRDRNPNHEWISRPARAT